jgi:hypothetical protein
MNPTYWYHPESDSVFIGNDEPGVPLQCVEIDEHKYVQMLIERIDKDPKHKLPEGISGVLKKAYTWPGNKLSGQIWYDKFNRFVNDYPINTSDIISKEPGGIYCTQHNKYLVEMIEPNVTVSYG